MIFTTKIKKKREKEKKEIVHTQLQAVPRQQKRQSSTMSQLVAWAGQTGKSGQFPLNLLISLPQKKKELESPPPTPQVKVPSRLFLERLRMVQNYNLNFRHS